MNHKYTIQITLNHRQEDGIGKWWFTFDGERKEIDQDKFWIYANELPKAEESIAKLVKSEIDEVLVIWNYELK